MSTPGDAGGRWEGRARKVEARSKRMRKHGRSLLTAVAAGEAKNVRQGRSGPKQRKAKRR